MAIALTADVLRTAENYCFRPYPRLYTNNNNTTLSQFWIS